MADPAPANGGAAAAAAAPAPAPAVTRHNGDDGDDIADGDVEHREVDTVDVADLEGDPDLAGSAPGSSQFQRWGKVGNLTEPQAAAYEEFVKQIPEEDILAVKNPHETVEHNALRWLRARDFKVKDSVKMFRNHKAWVSTSNFYALQFAPLAEVVGTSEIDDNFVIQNYPCGIKGHDRLGRPLYFKWYGKMKPKAIAAKVTAPNAAQWESVIGCLRVPYLFAQKSEEHGFHVEEMVVIIDCKGFKMKTFNKYVRDVLKHAADVSNPNFPEALGMCFVVNAPWFVKTIWAVAKGFLAKRTRKKFRILGKKFRKALHEVVDPSQLPLEYGGTGEKGFRTLEELFNYQQAFGVFNTPEYHAQVMADPRNKPYLELAKLQAEAAAAARGSAAAAAAPAATGGGGAKAATK